MSRTVSLEFLPVPVTKKSRRVSNILGNSELLFSELAWLGGVEPLLGLTSNLILPFVVTAFYDGNVLWRTVH